MSGRLDYDKAKRRSIGRRGEPISDTPHRLDISLRGWRTEYPEQFPVTVTKIEPEEADAA